MEYPDIQIAELKKVRRKQKFTNIEEGLFIGDTFVKFSARDILEGIECLIPEEFIDMPEEVQLMKYPSVSRPQRILTSLDSRVNFTFSLLKESIPEEQMEDLTAQLKELIHKTNPAAVFYREDAKELFNKKKIYMFNFKSFSVDGQIYHMMCFTSLNCGMLHATFNCPEEFSDDWEEAVWQAFQTIREKKTKK